MALNYNNLLTIFLLLITNVSSRKINLSPNASWDQNGITVAGWANGTRGSSPSQLDRPRGLSITSNDVLYVTDTYNHRIVVVHFGSTMNSSIIGAGRGSNLNQFQYPQQTIVTNRSIYILDRNNNRVQKLSLNGSDPTIVLSYNQSHYSSHFYVDDDANIYLSDANNHIVLLFRSNSSKGMIVAGTGVQGSSDDQLDNPYGLFAHRMGTIYIADRFNHRIMKWERGATSGIRMAGNGTAGSDVRQLDQPSYITVDTNEYIYISEEGNHRINRWAPNSAFGVCIAGCTGTSGIAPTQLNKPVSLAFDSYGSLYVSDWDNNRVQKFQILSNHDCRAPVIDLIPSALSLSRAVKFEENENINISSNIKINCSGSSLITIKWTILICLSTCSKEIQMNQSVERNLFIPARILSSGIYEVQLAVTMTDDPQLSSSSLTYIEITRSTIITNLISLTTSMITQNYEEDLTLNPGEFSIDLNRITLNKNDWIYLYYCQMDLINIQSWKLFQDPLQRCFRNQSVSWKCNDLINSSVTIFAKSLEMNQTCQFLVEMINRQDSSLRSMGYLTVKVEVFQSPIIQISCTISTMCSSKETFHYINPTNELSLSSFCTGNCSSTVDIRWNVYQGSINNGSVQWTLFPSISSSFFYGLKTKKLTIVKDFFLDNDAIIYWRLEVIYSFPLKTSEKIFDIQMNEKPKNGNCSIDPLNGTTMTLFTTNCSNWFDQDGIKDYTIYGLSINKSSIEMILTQSFQSIIQLRLPANINLIVSIRDTFDAIRKFHLPSILVRSDDSAVSNFIDILQKSSNNLSTDPIFQLLISGDKNTVGQTFTSMTQFLNDQSVESMARNGISPTTSLNNERSSSSEMNSSTNDENLKEYHDELNRHAHVREYLLMMINNLTIDSPTDVIFQSSILAELSETTNQLTRQSSNIASAKCQQLSDALKSIARRISAEDVNSTASYLLQCAVNALNGVNGVLQGRANLLDVDLNRAENDFNNKQDVDDESSLITNRNNYYQKESINQILEQMDRTISSVTSSLNLHLNLHQTIQIKTNSIEFSLEKLSKIPFPSILSEKFNETFLVRKIMEPLALGDLSDQNNAYTNFSRSFSLSILDQYENQMKINTNSTNPIEFIIPRDANIIIPDMFLQNVTTLKNEKKELFHYHQINLTQNNPNLTFSIHLEIQPLNVNLSYLLIYQFDQTPHLHSMENWTYLCLTDLNDDQIYLHFLDNHQTLHHHSIIYGIREFNFIGMNKFCSNKSLHPNLFVTNDQPFYFTSDYRLRIYQSGCFYLDSNHQWQSDGLLVGPSTNHSQTQCFSTHLTRFASAFVHLDASSTTVSVENISRECRTDRWNEEIDDLLTNRSTSLTNTVTNLFC